jgi:hypothetical protein
MGVEMTVLGLIKIGEEKYQKSLYTEVSVMDMMGRVVKNAVIDKDQNTKLYENTSGILIFVVGD